MFLLRLAKPKLQQLRETLASSPYRSSFQLIVRHFSSFKAPVAEKRSRSQPVEIEIIDCDPRNLLHLAKLIPHSGIKKALLLLVLLGRTNQNGDAHSDVIGSSESLEFAPNTKTCWWTLADLLSSDRRWFRLLAQFILPWVSLAKQLSLVLSVLDQGRHTCLWAPCNGPLSKLGGVSKRTSRGCLAAAIPSSTTWGSQDLGIFWSQGDHVPDTPESS